MFMFKYPPVEQDGYCASVSAQKIPGGRWKSWVGLERDSDFARLKNGATTPLPVPNSAPNEATAIEAAYAYARMLISREVAKIKEFS
jgi:hypothetical protein